MTEADDAVRAADPDRRVDLALEPPFRLGALTVAPASREVRGPGVRELLEPRVMQALVRLARTPGEVVSRDALFASCWEGRIVGEDAMNRVMSRLRRLSEADGGAGFTLETIRQVGYRLWPATAEAAAPMVAAASTAASARASGKPGIAVLPFVNLSGEPEQDGFVDAIASDLVTALAQWRWFSTTAWSASLPFRGAGGGVAEFSARLGVGYVLEGSLHKAQSRIRLSVRLIEAATGASLWAERYDRELVDVFALQDEITGHAVAAVEAAVLANEAVRSARIAPAERSALDRYFCGMAELQKDTAASHAEGLRLFQAAVVQQPSLALAHTGLARILYGGVVDGWSRAPQDDLHESRASARRGIELDPRESLAYYAFSGASLYLNDHSAALEHARRTVALTPSFALGHWRLGQVLIYCGHAPEAAAALELSIRLNPYDPQLGPMLGQLALALFYAGRFAEAEVQANAAISHKNARAAGVLAATLVQLGQLEDAGKAYKRLSSLPPGPPTLKAPYADRSQLDRLRDSLRIAAEVADLG